MRSAMTASLRSRAIRTANRPTTTRDLPKQVRSEIEKFFVATDELEDKELKFLGWKGRKTGERLIEKAAKRFKKANGKG
jgi:inorganic pyrophosphatase